MFRFAAIIVLLIHGLIHLMGFAKAFHLGSMQQIGRHVSKPAGIAWLIAALLFTVSAMLLLLKKQQWWMPALPAIVLSQILVIYWWQDARYGTIANILLLLAVVAGYGKWQFQQKYHRDVQARLAKHQARSAIITEEDIQHLPVPVQRYLRYTGSIGRPRIHNMRVTMEGRMRAKGKNWFPFTCVQYNFYDQALTRLFYMERKMSGMWVPGYHVYWNGIATMDIRAMGLFSVISAKGAEMNKAETVTLLNDMCFLAPGTLVDNRIRWEAVDDKNARAIFTCNGITVSAILVFNDRNQLVDFISDDRYDVNEMKQYRFSTPANDYRDFNGYKAAGFATAIWHYPDGPFTYGEFRIKNITYNIDHLK